jgi:hypothetical protein
VPGFLSSRPNMGSHHPLTCKGVLLLPPLGSGGDTLVRGGGGGGTQFRRRDMYDPSTAWLETGSRASEAAPPLLLLGQVLSTWHLTHGF